MDYTLYRPLDVSKWDIRYLEMARLVSTWSKDPSTQTGAVIVRPNKSVAGVGFNGFARNMPDTHELYHNREEKYSRIVHCEMNALMFVKDQSTDGYTLYTWPFISCDRCFVHMLQAGISRFVAPEATPEQLERWKVPFDKTRKYASEAGVAIVEVPHAVIERQK